MVHKLVVRGDDSMGLEESAVEGKVRHNILVVQPRCWVDRGMELVLHKAAFLEDRGMYLQLACLGTHSLLVYSEMLLDILQDYTLEWFEDLAVALRCVHCIHFFWELQLVELYDCDPFCYQCLGDRKRCLDRPLHSERMHHASRKEYGFRLQS